MTEVYAVLVEILKPAGEIAGFLALLSMGVRILMRAFTGKERFI